MIYNRMPFKTVEDKPPEPVYKPDWGNERWDERYAAIKSGRAREFYDEHQDDRSWLSLYILDYCILNDSMGSSYMYSNDQPTPSNKNTFFSIGSLTYPVSTTVYSNGYHFSGAVNTVYNTNLLDASVNLASLLTEIFQHAYDVPSPGIGNCQFNNYCTNIKVSGSGAYSLTLSFDMFA